MLHTKIQKQIPNRLSHYTNIDALKSILSNQDGKGICFWAFSNKYKNDDQEVKMGEYMLKRIRKVVPVQSLLHRFSGYENTASISFMEGEVNQHMLDEYGYVRLEFDLRELGVGLLTGGLIDCEYVPEDELKEYADEYCEMICSTYNSIHVLQKKYGKISSPSIDRLISFLMMENDIMTKVLGMKEQKWSEEMEWRIVLELIDGVEILRHKGKPYCKYYLDNTLLTGITVFSSLDRIDTAQEEAVEINRYIAGKGYKVKVQVEQYG